MNTKNLIAVAATVVASLGFASTAMAQEATPEKSFAPTKSVLTRQAVHQEAVTALAQGRILFGEASKVLPEPKSEVASATRAQVSEQAREAVRMGKVQYGEATRTL